MNEPSCQGSLSPVATCAKLLNSNIFWPWDAPHVTMSAEDGLLQNQIAQRFTVKELEIRLKDIILSFRKYNRSVSYVCMIAVVVNTQCSLTLT